MWIVKLTVCVSIVVYAFPARAILAGYEVRIQGTTIIQKVKVTYSMPNHLSMPGPGSGLGLELADSGLSTLCWLPLGYKI